LVYVVLLWSFFFSLSLLLLLWPMHISTPRTTLLSIIVFIPLTCRARKQKEASEAETLRSPHICPHP